MPFLSNQDLIFLSTSLLEKSKEFKELVHNQLYMKSGYLNIISELMERKLFSYIPIFEAELRVCSGHMMFLRKYHGSFKEDEHFPSN